MVAVQLALLLSQHLLRLGHLLALLYKLCMRNLPGGTTQTQK